MLIVLGTAGTGCATRNNIMGDSPPPCPIWDEQAEGQLFNLLNSEHWSSFNYNDLERMLGEQDRHCKALDAWIERNQ